VIYHYHIRKIFIVIDTMCELTIPKTEREKTVKLFETFFENKISSEIEEGCYHFSSQLCSHNKDYQKMFYGIYKENVKNLIYNLQSQNRTINDLILKIYEGKFNPYNLAFLRPEELDEDKWMKVILRKNTTQQKLNNLPTIEWKTCRSCLGKEYFFYQLQTRSADEPITNFYICKKCNKTYRVNG